VAQRASVQKCYAQIEYYSKIFSVSERVTEVLNIQDEADLDKDAPQLSPVVQIAPPFSEQLENVWFTDTSSKREGKIWKYRAVALEEGTKEENITEGEGSVQVGELTAAWSVFQHEAQATSPVYIYTDSCVVFKGCTEWLPFWEHLLKWLRVKRKHSGINDLFCEALAQGWPVTREECKTRISSCEQYHVHLGRHPLENDPTHLIEGKALWEAW